MATDAQVKEIALLKEYANRLDGFKDAILGGCMVLQNKAEAILDNLRNESNITDNNLQENQKLASRTIKVYEDIIRRYSLSSTSSSLLGSTPEEIKQSIKEIELCASEIKEKTDKTKSLIGTLQARTAAYAIAIRQMSENGCEQLKKRYAVLEQYKEQQT